MRSSLATGLTSLVLSTGLGIAQTAPTMPSFVSEVRVNNITVDVQVHDAQGVPVAGLHREQFRIFENDAEQAVTNFLVVEGGQVSESRDASLVGQPAPRQVLLFFDLYLLIEPDKKRAIESLREHFEAGLPPGMTVAVVSFDGAMRVHTEPTASRDKVMAALKEVSRLSATGLQRQLKLGSFDVRGMPRRESWGTFQARRMQNEEYWHEMRNMVGRVESAFTAALQRFSEGPGRKVVVFVSPGFPRAENVPLYREYDFFYDVPSDFRNVGMYGRAANLASELEYTMYGLDPSGSHLSDTDATVGAPPAFPDVASVAFWREADRKDNLVRAARLTGGEAMFTADSSGALSDVERLTASYYSLGYQPEHAGDGKLYAIRVAVVGHPEYKLTYRSSYLDRPFEQRDAERSRAALLTGQASNALGVELVLDKPTSKFRMAAAKMHVYRFGAELRIPYAQLTMLPRGESAWGQVQVVIVAVDDAGNQSELTHQRVPIQIAADKLAGARQGGYFAYRFTLELEGGATSVRVAVNDVLAHTTSMVIADLKL